MPLQLNHAIVPARDGEVSARWLADLFGLPAPKPFGPFWQVATANGVDLDFDTYGEEGSFTLQHHAFLVGEDDFDAIFARVLERGMDHWADPAALLRPVGSPGTSDGQGGVLFHPGIARVLDDA